MASSASVELGWRGLVAATVAAALVAVAGPAPVGDAAFPGMNGRVAFVRSDLSDGSCPNSQLFTTDAGGGSETAILPVLEGVIGGAAWSADGTQLALTVQTPQHEEVGVIGVLTVNADGTGAVGRVNLPVYDEWKCNPTGPTWSPEGDKIAVGSSSGIAVIDLDNANAVTYIDAGSPVFSDDPAWSPDGEQIAVAIRTTGELGLMPATGGPPVAVAGTNLGVRFPDWSPDGSKVVFQFGLAGRAVADLCSDDVDIVHQVGFFESQPVWSPDGTQHAYWSYGPGTNGIDDWDIFTSEPDGSVETNVTNTPHPIVESAPDWQPTGDPPEGTPCGAEMGVEIIPPEDEPAVNEGYLVRVRVTNLGDVPLQNVRVDGELPNTGGAEQVGGPHPLQVPVLEPEATVDFLYGFRATEEGETTFAAGVTAERGHVIVRKAPELVCQLGRAAPQGGHPCRNVALVTGNKLHLIRFYEHPPDFPNQSHAWVELVPKSGPQAGQPLFFGRYPGGANFMATHAYINDDSKTQWAFRITFAVTDAQYNAAAAYVNTQLALDTRKLYELLDENCMGFGQEVALAAGLDVSDLGMRNEINVPDPYSFHQSMEILYLTNASVSKGGGIVEKNFDFHAEGGDEPEPPRTVCSAKALSDAALAGQATLAAHLGLEFHKVGLPDVSIVTGGACTINLSNIDTSVAIVLVDFGDGSEVAQQDLSVLHSYPQPGTYVLRVITVDQGAVREWTIDVMVGAGNGQCSEAIEVPEPPPPGWDSTPENAQTTSPAAVTDEIRWGDQDCEGSVGPGDVSSLLAFLAGLGSAEVSCAVAGAGGPAGWRDVDCSGEVAPGDSLFILLSLADLGTTPGGDCPALGDIVSS